MSKKLLIVVSMVFLIFAMLNAQDFDVPIGVTDGLNNVTLTIGVDPNGTSVFDPGLDVLAPPPPPSGAFDGRLIGPDNENYLTDIRDNTQVEKTFRMKYVAATGQGPIVLTWDNVALGPLGTFFIVDDITGTLFGPLDMKTVNTLTITDPLILSGLRILVTPSGPPPVNHPPVLAAIANQTMDEGTTLSVPVSATDIDGDNIALNVNNLPSFGTFLDNGNGTGTITFNAGYFDSGTYPNIEVIATDNGTPPMADTVTFDLTVNEVNRPPVLDPIANQVMQENTTLDVGVNATDPDNDNLTLSVSNLPGFGSFVDNGDGTGTISFAPVSGDSGAYPNIQVTVTDNGTPAMSDTKSFDLTVIPPITAQVIYTVGDDAGAPGSLVTVAVSLDFPDSVNICAFGFNLMFDPALVSYHSWTPGPIVPVPGFFNSASLIGPGLLNISGFSTSGLSLTGDGDLAFVTFQINNSAPAGPVQLSFDIATAGDCNGHDLTTDFSDTGQILVITVVDLCGTVYYFDETSTPSIPAENIPVYLLDAAFVKLDSTVTDANGAYCFLGVNAGQDYNIMPRLVDDPNRLLMAVNPTDAFRAFAAATFSLPFHNPYQFLISDANNSNTFNPTDAFVIFQLGSYQIPNLRAYGLDDWNFMPLSYPINTTNWMMAPNSINLMHVLNNLSGLDFLAGIYGDANGSGAGLVTSLTKPAGETIAMSIPQIRVTENGSLEIPVQLQLNGSRLGAFEAELTYDTDHFEFVTQRFGDVIDHPAEWTLYQDANQSGKVYLAGFATDNEALIENEGILSTLVFKPVSQLSDNQTYEFAFSERVSAGNDAGQDLQVHTSNGVLGLDAGIIPSRFVLNQNYPNPFNPSTLIRFGIPEDSRVTLEVFNLVGQRVVTLVDRTLPAGYHSVTFEPDQISSGVYFYTLRTKKYTAMKKMLYIR